MNTLWLAVWLLLHCGESVARGGQPSATTRRRVGATASASGQSHLRSTAHPRHAGRGRQAPAAVQEASRPAVLDDQPSGVWADVPPSHWAYADLDVLAQAGLADRSYAECRRARRAMTRYEFGIVTQRALDARGRQRFDQESAPEAGASTQAQTALARLAGEFADARRALPPRVVTDGSSPRAVADVLGPRAIPGFRPLGALREGSLLDAAWRVPSGARKYVDGSPDR